MDHETQNSDTVDPWDRALLGSAAASMYRSAPAAKQATPAAAPVPPQPRSNDVTSLFRAKAGIPHDIKPVPPPPAPVAKPLAPLPSPTRPVTLPDVKASPVVVLPPPPKAPAKVAPEISILASVPRKAAPQLVPAHPMRAVALHLMILLLGIPLFVGGFYLADYLKNSLEQPTVAAVQQSQQ